MIDILRALASGETVPGRHVVVTAHPDDESVSFGGALCLLEHVVIVQLTTGANEGAEDVAALRAAERSAACAAAAWPWQVIDCGVPGREAFRHLSTLRPIVAAAMAEADYVWTHPYEGGHLDHDTAAFLVQQIGWPVRMEFASYHCSERAQVFGDFWPDAAHPAAHVRLSGPILARKLAAIAAYTSQAAILRKFPRQDVEAYRSAPVYDFRRPSPAPRCRWDVKGYRPRTHEWRTVVAA